MKALILLLFLCARVVAGDLIWNEEFNGDKLDTNKWAFYDLNQIRHDAFHTEQALKIADGNLHIAPFTERGNHYSVIVKTKATFTLGYFELRAKVIPQAGQWIDWWALCPEMLADSPSIIEPQEVDLFEIRKTDESEKDISSSIFYAVHRISYDPRLHKGDGDLVAIPNLNDSKYHIFGWYRSKDLYIMYVDGKETWRCNHTSDIPFYLLLSCEILDNYWAGKVPKEGYDGAAVFSVDYLRIYALD